MYTYRHINFLLNIKVFQNIKSSFKLDFQNFPFYLPWKLENWSQYFHKKFK